MTKIPSRHWISVTRPHAIWIIRKESNAKNCGAG